MAPEQAEGAKGRVGPPADVYALGAVLYECLTGRPPFQGADVLDVLAQVRRQEPASPRALRPRVPRDLEAICLGCLRKEPGRRYPSAAALADDLAAFRQGRPIQGRPYSPLDRLLLRARRAPRRAAVILAFVAAGVALLARVVLLSPLVLPGREVRPANTPLNQKPESGPPARDPAIRNSVALADGSVLVHMASGALHRHDGEKRDYVMGQVARAEVLASGEVLAWRIRGRTGWLKDGQLLRSPTGLPSTFTREANVRDTVELADGSVLLHLNRYQGTEGTIWRQTTGGVRAYIMGQVARVEVLASGKTLAWRFRGHAGWPKDGQLYDSPSGLPGTFARDAAVRDAVVLPDESVLVHLDHGALWRQTADGRRSYVHGDVVKVERTGSNRILSWRRGELWASPTGLPNAFARDAAVRSAVVLADGAALVHLTDDTLVRQVGERRDLVLGQVTKVEALPSGAVLAWRTSGELFRNTSGEPGSFVRD